MSVFDHDLTREEKTRVIAKINAPVNYDLIKQNKYDKFGDGDYISVETVTDLLNETFGYTWSWEIVNFFHNAKDGGEEYVVCHGRLSVPGFGTREGVGQAKADKKDNSTMYSAAASFAFKAAAKRFGIASNLFNKDGYYQDNGQMTLDRIPVFEPGYEPQPTKPAKQAVPDIPDSQRGRIDQAQAEAAPAEAPARPEAPKSQAVKSEAPQSAKECGAELKEAYGLSTKAQFIAFAQIWNPNITKFEDITPEVMIELHAYAEDNPEEFEDFVASDY